MRPDGFRAPEQLPHGTRSRYTAAGCRCDKCRAANTQAYRERRARELEQLAELTPAAPAAAVTRSWRPRGGAAATVRTYRNACPGVEGKPCPREAYVRRDSPGGICEMCRRRLFFNGLVDAGPTRRHLRKLARKGIGWKAVADACDVARTVLWEVRSGRKLQIKAETARRVLKVDEGARAGGALVPAARTWMLIGKLMDEGFTKKEIARRLGRRSSLQLRPTQVTARSAHAIEKLYRLVMY